MRDLCAVTAAVSSVSIAALTQRSRSSRIKDGSRREALPLSEPL